MGRADHRPYVYLLQAKWPGGLAISFWRETVSEGALGRLTVLLFGLIWFQQPAASFTIYPKQLPPSKVLLVIRTRLTTHSTRNGVLGLDWGFRSIRTFSVAKGLF